MFRKVSLIMFVVVLSLVVAVPAAFADRGGAGGRGDGPVIYVTGPELYYDSIVTADPLPAKGPFQRNSDRATPAMSAGAGGWM